MRAQQADDPQDGLQLPSAVAAYDQDPAIAASRCFDRTTGKPVRQEALKTYLQALAQYHLHPEAKFANADYLDRGVTTRRHIVVDVVEHIGKEANRWEEQLYLGEDPEAQIEYGTSPEDLQRLLGSVLRKAQLFGQRQLATAAGLSLSEVSAVLTGQRKNPTHETLAKLYKGLQDLEAARRDQTEHETAVLTAVKKRCRRLTLRQFADNAAINASHLSEVLNGKRKLSKTMLAKLEKTLQDAHGGADGAAAT